jgi:predicted alpha/beta hydrolase family esterase
MDFNECLKKRIAKGVAEDKELIASLIKTSQNKFDSEKKLELTEVTSNSKISLLYDSLRELLEALAIKNGYKIYNHECYTHFLKEILNESIKGDEFDELRKIRNSINYYAKDVTVNEAKDILGRITKLREEILNLLLKIKRAFIVHRWGGTPGADWYPWLKKELEKKGFKVEVPTMPNTSEPKINDWVSHLKKVVGKLDNETYFVGHSIGCQAIMRFLEKEDYDGKLGNVVFVAGWFKLNNLEGKEVEAIASPWMDTPIDFNKIKPKLSKLSVFLSTNEPYGFIEENSKAFRDELGAKVITLKNRGHFTAGDGVNKLPEILNEIN